MTIDIKQLGGLLERVTPGEWSYRPNELDDWGYVRGGESDIRWGVGIICQVRDPRYLDGLYLSRCRSEKRDPWEDNARLVALAPSLARRVIAAEKLAEAARCLSYKVSTEGVKSLETALTEWDKSQ